MMHMTVHAQYACPPPGGTYVELLELCKQRGDEAVISDTRHTSVFLLHV